MKLSRILVVDDDPRLLRVLKLQLEAEGYAVAAMETAEEALARIDEIRPQFVLAGSADLLAGLQERHPGLPVAILAERTGVREAVSALQDGAVDVLAKPVDRNQLLACIRRHLGDAGAARAEWGAYFIGRSPTTQAMLEDARRVAPTDAAVLLRGATGTGKETLARAMHDASKRRARAFIAIHCAALPPARTFDRADGGSIYLEDVDAIPIELQGKLLRLLREVDARVFSATQGDLEQQVRARTFREDLYYRLSVVQLRLAPLAERREDIPLLVGHSLAQRVAAGAPRRIYAPQAMETLVAAAWPGNIGQLFSVVEQTAALSPSRVISAALVRRALGEQAAPLPSFDLARTEFTRKYLRQLLELADGNISRAARLAERNRTDFYKLLSRFGVNPGSFKERELRT